MDTHSCIETLLLTMTRYGFPEILNSDQGSQFSSKEFTDELKSYGFKISLNQEICPTNGVRCTSLSCFFYINVVGSKRVISVGINVTPRNKSRRGEVGIAEPHIQHGQILHIEDANRIKRRRLSRKSQKKTIIPIFNP